MSYRHFTVPFNSAYLIYALNGCKIACQKSTLERWPQIKVSCSELLWVSILRAQGQAAWPRWLVTLVFWSVEELQPAAVLEKGDHGEQSSTCLPCFQVEQPYSPVGWVVPCAQWSQEPLCRGFWQIRALGSCWNLVTVMDICLQHLHMPAPVEISL